jgi:Ni/Co efflux regulator RcnB
MSRLVILISLLALLLSPMQETAASTSSQPAPQASTQEAREGNRSQNGHIDAANKRKHKKKGKKNRNKKNKNKKKGNTCFG